MSEPSPNRFIGYLRLFVDIVRLRKGPEDLPVSRALLAACILGDVGVRALLVSAVPMPFQGNPIAILMLDAGATLVFVALVVALVRRPERFPQTATAVFGCQLVMLPMLVGSGWLYAAFEANIFWRLPMAMVMVAAQVWALAVIARILHSATNWPLFACVAVAIAGDLMTAVAVASVFPLAIAVQA